MIGKSLKMKKIYRLLEKVPSSDASVLFKEKMELVKSWLLEPSIIFLQEKIKCFLPLTAQLLMKTS